MFKNSKKLLSILLALILAFNFVAIENVHAEGETKLIFHFDNPKNEDWRLWVWPKDGEGAEYEFTSEDDFGKVTEITLDSKYEEIGFLVKGPNWEKNITEDRFVKTPNETTEIWIRSEDPEVYLEPTKSLDEEDIRIVDFTVDKFTEATVRFSKNTSLADFTEDYDVKLEGQSIKDTVEQVVSTSGDDDQTDAVTITFNKDLPLDNNLEISFQSENEGNIINLNYKSRLNQLVSDPKFDEMFYYDGELGSIYTPEATTFKIWAPLSDVVELVLFDGDNETEKINMEKKDKGVFEYTLEGDHLGQVYMYDVHLQEEVNSVVDPYAKAVAINGQKGVVADPQKTNVSRPEGRDMTNPIIYELHVRDFSIAENSGMENKGKFLALTEEGTKADNGQITGLDYLKSLGITHVQLLPIYDYNIASVDESKDEPQFNWGYDPLNYNAPEGSYSTDAYDPMTRIKELQQTIDTLHENGLGVIMDVVYNHVFDAGQHWLEKIVPGYYFRKNPDGSFQGGTGVGNETASERMMVRKYIVDSITYWAETYNLDGFRFDLMGTHDYETMNIVYDELKKINPNIFILGEGWNMDMGIPEDMRATQLNAKHMPNLKFFSDDMRDTLKGNVFDDLDKGYVNGRSGLEQAIYTNIKGANGLQSYTTADQVIQYVEAHDNLTLWDKLTVTTKENDETKLKRHKLSTSIVMLSQGHPFIHAGQEFGRTKNMDHNSYKSPDSINQFDWDRVLNMSDNIDYFRELINIRKNYDAFYLKDYEEIDNVYEEISIGEGLISYKVSDEKGDIYIGYNSTKEALSFEVPNGEYNILINDQVANAEGIESVSISDGVAEVAPLSTYMIVSNGEVSTDTFDEEISDIDADDKENIDAPTEEDTISPLVYIAGGALVLLAIIALIKRKK